LVYKVGLTSFASSSQLFALFPDMFGGIYIRRLWYKWTLNKCGHHLVISWLAVIHNACTTIGNECYIGQNVTIGWAEIGDQCLIASNTLIASGVQQHGIVSEIPIRKQPGQISKTNIGNDVWIGAGCLIAANVPDGCVVGLGSVVWDDLEQDNAIYGGYPARLIRYRSEAR
jgi:acetyltransferase-like isoleucine patch superfamily enzyme